MIDVTTPAAPCAPPLTARTILDALRSHHAGEILVEELANGTGGHASNRIDLWAMHEWPSQGNRRFAYEVKVSRSDFLREVKDPLKRRAAMRYSNFFYFAAPAGLIRVEEVPPDCGLVEIVWREHAFRPGQWYWGVDRKVPAPFRDAWPPSWNFVASLLRAVRRV